VPYTRDLLGKPFHPTFRPHLRPQRMLKLGIFGGTYFARRPQDWLELPATWRNGIQQLLPARQYDPSLNHFGVRAGLSYEQWRAKGWINPIDPLGWFQWYCRYTLGRRCADDERQILRWRSYRRHVAQLITICRRHGRKLNDASIAPVARQALLHWAYDPYLAELTTSDLKDNPREISQLS
jgi:hypothetical protein